MAPLREVERKPMEYRQHGHACQDSIGFFTCELAVLGGVTVRYLSVEEDVMIQQERIKQLNRGEVARGDYVLYWMQASQRAEYNHALEYAIGRANELRKPLVVYFGLTDHYPEANERHYVFMLEGLKETRRSLEKRGIRMVIRHESPEIGAAEMARRASMVVADRGYLGFQREWRKHVARSARCPVIQIETDVVVPVETASPKEAYMAANLRPKIARHLHDFLVPLKAARVRNPSLEMRLDSLDIEDTRTAISRLRIDRGVGPVSTFHGGTSQAKKHLKTFIERRLDAYADARNDPTKDGQSDLSPYLHFGQISPLYIALKVLDAGGGGDDTFLEELIVRRELSMNFAFCNPNCASFDGLPDWAKKTLHQHLRDDRPGIVPLHRLEPGDSPDPYWNAAQHQMICTGKMHGYLRMYWGKRLIEWTDTPEEAFDIAVYLNNKYELDGRDPNSYAGIAWCFGKHDRPWFPRPVFGNVRSMGPRGLEQKFDAPAYIHKVERECVTGH